MAALPRVYLGTMTFGWSQASSKVDASVATGMVRKFAAAFPQGSPIHIDTARIYASGDTEPIVAAALSGTAGPDFKVGSKAHPSQQGGLSDVGLRGQLDASCAALQATSLDEFYLHQPDTEHALLESLKTCDALVKEGKVRSVGLSNYHASEVARAMALCDEHSLVKPSVYQGIYNPLNRAVEEELLPVLRKHGCAFIAYNPLAAGLLTGAHSPGGEVKAGRFKDNPNYLPRFYTDANFTALGVMKAACDGAAIGLVEATYRWLLCHSALRADSRDGLLSGASSLEQLDSNLAAVDAARTAGPLPTAVHAAFEGAWAARKLREEAFPYWRSYSADMPGREGLHQGASYNAAKTK
jgi:aflatoxin B1 aldehyde reductase